MRSGSTSGPVGGCQLVILELGIGWTGTTLLRPLCVHRGIHGDAAEPPADAAAAELCDVGTPRRTPPGRHPTPGRDRGPCARRARQLVLVGLDEVVERARGPRPRSLDEDQVAALDGVFDHLVRAKVVHGLGGLPTAMARRGESSIGFRRRRRPDGPVPRSSLAPVRPRHGAIVRSQPKWRNGRRGGPNTAVRKGVRVRVPPSAPHAGAGRAGRVQSMVFTKPILSRLPYVDAPMANTSHAKATITATRSRP